MMLHADGRDPLHRFAHIPERPIGLGIPTPGFGYAEDRPVEKFSDLGEHWQEMREWAYASAVLPERPIGGDTAGSGFGSALSGLTDSQRDAARIIFLLMQKLDELLKPGAPSGFQWGRDLPEERG